MKIKNVLLGFASCCFFHKLSPEGQLNHETYVSKLIKNRTSGVVYHITIWYHHMICPYHITIWYLHMMKMYPKKTIYDIGTKILFGASMSHKPIKNWEIENVKTWFWKLSTSTIWWHCQNVISSHSWKSNKNNLVLQVVVFFKNCRRRLPKAWTLCFLS